MRAKQGKAQLHHLRQGGPGRMSVGGGIRARESERLFSRICEVLDLFSFPFSFSDFAVRYYAYYTSTIYQLFLSGYLL